MNRHARKSGSSAAKQPVVLDVEDLLIAGGVALVVARWLVPTESSTAGETLWLVELWLILAAAWCWLRLRRGTGPHRRLDRLDLAIGLLAATQVVSAVVLLLTRDGDARAAINVAWEWIGLAVGFGWLRHWLATRQARAAMLLVFLAVTTSLAGLGTWQHHVGYRLQRGEYDELRQNLDTAEATGNRQRAGELRNEFIRQGIPVDGPGRELFERRLRDSSEPIGLFALANSFAGLLAVAALVLAALLTVPGLRSIDRMAIAAAGLPVVYCLVLTKSRSAWAGLLVGLACWAVVERRRLFAAPRRVAVIAAAGLMVAGGLVAAAMLSGGIDRYVLSEAPKSFRYRLEYWQATGDVIRRRPWLGTGPGNFRQHYLASKLAGSSEEVSDPHNAVLEAWATAGTPGLLALAAVVLVAVSGTRGATRRDDRPPPQGAAAHGDRHATAIIVGGGGGFLLAWSQTAVFTGNPDHRIVMLLGGWAVAVMLLTRPLLGLASPGRLVPAAAAAIGVHLLAAGGFSMPAVMQTVLLLLVLWRPACSGGAPRRRSPVVATGIATALALACLLTAFWPVLRSQAAVSLGRTALLVDRNERAAVESFETAERADPLSPAPPRYLADLRFGQWSRDRDSSDRLDQALAAAKRAVAHDRHSWLGYRRLAAFHEARFHHGQDPDDADLAIEFFDQALARYPSNSRLLAGQALFLASAGRDDRARTRAGEALRLDRLNRDRGHVEKLLPGPTVEELERLVDNDDRN